MADPVFSSKAERNSFIKNQSKNLSGAKIGKIVSLSRGMVNHIRSEKKRIYKRKYVNIICPICKESRKKRRLRHSDV